MLDLLQPPREQPPRQGGELTAALLILCLFVGSLIAKVIVNRIDEREARDDLQWQEQMQAGTSGN